MEEEITCLYSLQNNDIQRMTPVEKTQPSFFLYSMRDRMWLCNVL